MIVVNEEIGDTEIDYTKNEYIVDWITEFLADPFKSLKVLQSEYEGYED